MQIIIIFSLYWCIYLYIYTFYCVTTNTLSRNITIFLLWVLSLGRSSRIPSQEKMLCDKVNAWPSTKRVRTKDYHTNSIKERVNVTSENYNKKLFFSSRCYSNDITQWFKFKIQATSKTERENDKLVLRSFPLKFGGEKNWEEDY